jgi:hypothetical protein
MSSRDRRAVNAPTDRFSVSDHDLAGGSKTISKGGTDLGAQISGGIQVVSGWRRHHLRWVWGMGDTIGEPLRRSEFRPHTDGSLEERNFRFDYELLNTPASE